MKPHHLIAPALALVVAALWINHQENTFSQLTEKTIVMRGRIGIARGIRTSIETPATQESTAAIEQDPFSHPDGSLN